MDQHPIAKMINANEPVSETIQRLINKFPVSHYINLHVRINGKWEIYEADWLKDLFRKIK